MILRSDDGGEAGKVRMPSKLGGPGFRRAYRRCGQLLPWRLRGSRYADEINNNAPASFGL
ncbi:hypothetical protein DXT94_12605 [Rhizobium sp. ICMP 5592]|nr:hypothetical protein [Rhizobium sp. ICMP 5592]